VLFPGFVCRSPFSGAEHDLELRVTRTPKHSVHVRSSHGERTALLLTPQSRLSRFQLGVPGPGVALLPLALTRLRYRWIRHPPRCAACDCDRSSINNLATLVPPTASTGAPGRLSTSSSTV
jgi:hypothetical protein